MFHRNTVRGRLSLRPLGSYGKARKAARYRNAVLLRNAVGEGIFRLNTDGVLLWGAGLCGRRYSRCTHCHEPHGGTVSNQTKSRNTKYLPESVETISQTAIKCKYLQMDGVLLGTLRFYSVFFLFSSTKIGHSRLSVKNRYAISDKNILRSYVVRYFYPKFLACHPSASWKM